MKHFKILRKPAGFLLGAIVAAAPAAAIATGFAGVDREITLRAQAEVWSQTVCLHDVVQEGWIQGRCSVDRANCCKWNLGGERTHVFSRSEISRELSKIGFPGFNLVLSGTGDSVAVTQTRRELTAAEVSVKLRAAAIAKLGADAEKLSVESVRLVNPTLVNLNEENDWDVAIVEPMHQTVSAKIVSTKDGLQVMGWVEAAIRLDADVYVARRTIAPSESLELTDFELKRTSILGRNTDQAGLFRSGAFPAGVRAKQTIQSGSPLLSAAVERIPMVKLGDTVTLLLRSDNLRVSTKGVVQGQAGLGDMVTVQLPRYNRTFRGRLVEGRLVEVWL